MGTIRLTDVSLLSGKRGTGKTYFCKYFIKEHLLGKVKVFIYDPLYQYGDMGDVVHSLDKIKSNFRKDLKKAIVFQPTPERDDDEHFDIVMKWVYLNGNMFLVGEEINEYMTPYKITPHFKTLMRRGRNKGIGLLAVSHRPAHISLNFLNFIDHWFIFRQDLPSDLKRLEEYLLRTDAKFDGDYIARLPDRYFIYYYTDRDTGRSVAMLHQPVKSNIKDTNIKEENPFLNSEW